jgi:butyrate kinase
MRRECGVQRGHDDAIILTGGMAYNEYLTTQTIWTAYGSSRRCTSIREDEIVGMAEDGLAVLRGEMIAKEYAEKRLSG